MVHMTLDYDDSPRVYKETVDQINYFFTGVFIIEAILKLIAFGSGYFQIGWNIFDFCVVCTSLFEIILDNLDSRSMRFLRLGPQLAKVLRVMRVGRLIRLINRYRGLDALLQTIWFALPAVLNVFSLLMLIYFIFAILGTFLFRHLTQGQQVINYHFNFSNFGYAMIICVRMSTGEDWNNIMTDCMYTDPTCVPGVSCGSPYAFLYFVPYQMICCFVMLKLFQLVIIQQFETYYLDADNVIMRFKEDLVRFKRTWTHFTHKNGCLKLKDTRLVAFMANLPAPLGMQGESVGEIIKSVMQMELVSDNEGFVYFNELLFRVMRARYGDPHVKNKVIIEQELVTMKKLKEIKEKMIKYSRVQERKEAVAVNPFTLQLFMNVSFKAWLKLARGNAGRRMEEREIGLDKVDADSFEDVVQEQFKKAHQEEQV